MKTIIDNLCEEEIRNRLTEKNYEIIDSHVFPDVYSLSQEYPWSLLKSMYKGPVKKGLDIRIFGNYPLPCAYFLKDKGLIFVNEDEPELKKYHEEIKSILY